MYFHFTCLSLYPCVICCCRVIISLWIWGNCNPDAQERAHWEKWAGAHVFHVFIPCSAFHSPVTSPALMHCTLPGWALWRLWGLSPSSVGHAVYLPSEDLTCPYLGFPCDVGRSQVQVLRARTMIRELKVDTIDKSHLDICWGKSASPVIFTGQTTEYRSWTGVRSPCQKLPCRHLQVLPLCFWSPEASGVHR